MPCAWMDIFAPAYTTTVGCHEPGWTSLHLHIPLLWDAMCLDGHLCTYIYNYCGMSCAWMDIFAPTYITTVGCHVPGWTSLHLHIPLLWDAMCLDRHLCTYIYHYCGMPCAWMDIFAPTYITTVGCRVPGWTSLHLHISLLWDATCLDGHLCTYIYHYCGMPCAWMDIFAPTYTTTVGCHVPG